MTGITTVLRPAVDPILGKIGFAALKFGFTRGVAVLGYHGVPDAGSFSEQLEMLAVHSPQIVTTTDLATGSEFDGPTVCFTFDDGHRSVYDVAFPLLRERNWTATLFPVAGLIGTEQPFWWDEVVIRLRDGATAQGLPRDPHEAIRRMKLVPDSKRRAFLEELRNETTTRVSQQHLSWDEIRELSANGWEIGNHTWSHPCLDRCSPDVARSELRSAHDLIAQEVGRPPDTIAYPNGNLNGDVRQSVAELGYRTAFLFDHRFTHPDKQDPLRLSRLRVDACASRNRFLSIVSGVHPRLHHAVGRS